MGSSIEQKRRRIQQRPSEVLRDFEPLRTSRRAEVYRPGDEWRFVYGKDWQPTPESRT